MCRAVFIVIAANWSSTVKGQTLDVGVEWCSVINHSFSDMGEQAYTKTFKHMEQGEIGK